MSLADIAKRHREAKLAQSGEKAGLVKKTKEKSALSLGELLKKKKVDNTGDKGLNLSSLVKKPTKLQKPVVTKEQEEVEEVTTKVEKLEIKQSQVYKR